MVRNVKSGAERCVTLTAQAPRHNGSAITSKETTQTPLPQLVNALGITHSSKTASYKTVK